MVFHWWLALRLKLLVYLIDDGLHTVRIGVTAELRLYASRMHGGSAHAALLVPLVESNGKKDISRLRSTISDERVIGCPLKVGILQIDIGVTVTRRSQVNQPASRADKTRNPVNENKVAQMIGPELRLKTSRRFAKRRGHDAGVGDNDIEGVASCHQLIGAGTHALEIGEVELNELKASTIGRSVLPDLRRRCFCLRQISRRAHNRPCAASARAVSTPSPAETPVTRIRLPCRLTPDKTSSVVEVAPNTLFVDVASITFSTFLLHDDTTGHRSVTR